MKPLPEPDNDFDRKLLADIARVGWAVVAIPEDDEGPGYAFSVGLYHTYGHPEIILFGLPVPVSYRLVNNVGFEVKNGRLFEAGREYDGLTVDYPDAFVTVDRARYREYLGTAGWFYQGWDFPALQMVWCNRERAWPWDAGQESARWRRQPLLGTFVAAEDVG